MNKTILTSTAFGLMLFAMPAMAHGQYEPNGYPGLEPVTGAQMTDWPSGRFNMTESPSGSFLRLGSHYANAYGYRSHYPYRHRDHSYDTQYDNHEDEEQR